MEIAFSFNCSLIICWLLWNIIIHFWDTKCNWFKPTFHLFILNKVGCKIHKYIVCYVLVVTLCIHGHQSIPCSKNQKTIFYYKFMLQAICYGFNECFNLKIFWTFSMLQLKSSQIAQTYCINWFSFSNNHKIKLLQNFKEEPRYKTLNNSWNHEFIVIAVL